MLQLVLGLACRDLLLLLECVGDAGLLLNDITLGTCRQQ